MLFKSQKALNYLLKHGIVYTLRPKRRREGKDWITDKRGGRKITDVKVSLVGEVIIREGLPSLVKLHLKHEPENKVHRTTVLLEDYARRSGFYSEDEWLEEVRRLNGTLPKKAWLYRVELLNNPLTLEDKLYRSRVAVKCARCGSEEVIYFHDSQVGTLRTDRTLWNMKAIHAKFYLCYDCAKKLDELLAKFLSGG